MADLKMIERLTSAFGPSGFEEDVADIIKDYCKDFDAKNDSMNNVIARLKNNTGKRPVVLLDAHSDELGFMVKSINSKGFIEFINLGAWVDSAIPAHTVMIKNNKGQLVKGIITSKPPHFMSEAEKKIGLDLENTFIDVGAVSYDEVINDFGIQPGDPVMPDVAFEYNDKNKVLLGKAFDNRLGCACILEAMNMLKDENGLIVDIVGGFAAQEEVGTRGAQVTAQTVKPDLAIVFEGTPADDIYYDEYKSQGAMKKGTQIRHRDASYISSTEFIRYAKTLADKKGIKYQSAVRTSGSTNAGKIHLTNEGVPVLVLGVPTRYAHTHYNYCALEDFEATVELAVEVIKNFTTETVNKILKK